jgi:hypothetical protein
MKKRISKALLGLFYDPEFGVDIFLRNGLHGVIIPEDEDSPTSDSVKRTTIGQLWVSKSVC